MQNRHYDQIVSMNAIATRLEPVMTKLAKACLMNKPDDIDQFCYDFFARRIGKEKQVEGKRRPCNNKGSPAEDTVNAVDDDLDDEEVKEKVERTVSQIRAKNMEALGKKKTYESSDDEEKFLSGTLDESAQACVAACDDEPAQDVDNPTFSAGRVLSVEPTTALPHEVQYGGKLPPEEEAKLQAKIADALRDPRMKILFDIWDADGSGDVDLTELVIALHKFNRVMEEGTDLRRASDALICAESSSSSQKCELNLSEVARLVVQFCEEAYSKSFSEMADHLITVARSTSERAALAAASGEDVARLEKLDNEEFEVLKATLLGFENSVVKNIERIKTERRVNFK